MVGHTYWRTLTANRKSITKASSSLLDFSSTFPTLGETQAPYGNPATQPAPAARTASPQAPLLLPFPPPVGTEYSTVAAAAAAGPSPLPSFPQAQRCGCRRTPLLPRPTPDRWPPALSPHRSSLERLRRVSYLWDPACSGCPTPRLLPRVQGSAHLIPLLVAPRLPSPFRFAHRTLPGASAPSPLGAYAATSSPAQSRAPSPCASEALLLPAPGCSPWGPPRGSSEPGVQSSPGGRGAARTPTC